MITIAALIDKIARHLLRRNLGSELTYTIVDPMMYLSDIYVDMTLSALIEDEIWDIYDKINRMDDLLEENAPVYMICGRQGDVKLDKSDIKLSDDYTDDGLSRVDNTPDDSKPPSNPFKESWLYTYTSIMVPSYTKMNEQIYAYRIHVTGDGNSPIKSNPHGDLLTAGIWYGDQIIRLNPDTFLHRQIFTDHLADHNADTSAHQVIQDITKPIIGGEAPGTLYRDVQRLTDREVAYNATVVPTVNNAAVIATNQHNNRTDVHQYIQASMEYEGTDHLNVLFEEKEVSMYEYQKYKIKSITPDGVYTNEYPDVYAVFPLLPKQHAGVDFVNKDNVPAVELLSGDATIRIHTSDGSVHDITSSRRKGDTQMGFLYVNYIDVVPDEGGWPAVAFVAAYARTGTIYCGGDTLGAMLKFTIDFGGDNRAITHVSYSDDPVDAITAYERYSYVNAGILFSKYGVSLDRRYGDINIRKDFTQCDLSSPESMTDTVVTMTEDYTDPNYRILRITRPSGYHTGSTTAVQMQSIDFDDELQQTNPVQVGYAEPVLELHQGSSGEVVSENAVTCGIQIDNMPLSGDFRIAFDGDMFSTYNATASFVTLQ